MKWTLTSALLFAFAVAGPMDRGSISPGGTLGLSGSWVSDARQTSLWLTLTPGLEYAIARNVFVGGNLSLQAFSTSYAGSSSQNDLGLGTTDRTTILAVGPTVRLCLASSPPWPFVRLAPSGSMQWTNDYGFLGLSVAGSVGTLTMLSHGVALEPALTLSWTDVRTTGSAPAGRTTVLHAGIGIGLSGYIYK